MPFLLVPLAPILAGFSYRAGGYVDARNVPTAGSRPAKGKSSEIPDFISHDSGRWTLHFLQRGRADRRADASHAAWTSVFVPDVRAAVLPAFRSLSPVGHSDWPDPKTFAYTFDRIAETMSHLTESLGLARYTLYIQDYGGPVGFRMALAHPDRIAGFIVQDAVAHNEGLGANWKTRRAFWADGAANESALRTNLLSLQTTRTRHVGGDPNLERYDPDLWTDEFAFLNQPGQVEIQSDLFFDYRTNVENYPRWQARMREKQPRVLVIWGKYESSFESSEPESYRRDVPNAEIHIVDGGHFALDTAADEIAALVGQFMKTQR